MKPARFLALGVLIFIFAFSTLLYADVPHMINYQGKLTTPEGALIDDTLSMTFAIFPDSVGFDTLWSEIQDSVVVDKGLFSVLLGSVYPIFASIFDGEVRYLGMKVEDDSEMTPRKKIVSAAYAYRSEYSDTADYAFAAPGGGNSGWVDAGSVVGLETSTDSVGIGTSTPAEKLDVEGNIHASGTIKSGNSIVIDGTTGEISTEGGNDISLVADEVLISGKATIGPGHTNTGANAFVAGANNTVDQPYTTIGGGRGHYAFATGYASTIGGGDNNITQGYCNTIGGGHMNAVQDSFGTVGGGRSNGAKNYATVGGGYGNVALGSNASIGGGFFNTVEGDYSAILGGYRDTIATTGDYSYLFGIGSKLTQDSTFMVDMPHIRFGDETNGYEFPISDGSSGQVMATDGSGQLSWTDAPLDYDWEFRVTDGADTTLITKGEWGIARAGNTLYGSADSTHVNLGVGCTTGTSGQDIKYCTVGGGFYNRATGLGATVCGGVDNEAGDVEATVAGGFANVASGYRATVGGGEQNRSGNRATVGGGWMNTAASERTTVSGGEQNLAYMHFSTVGGGLADTATAFYSGVFSGYSNLAGDDFADTGAVVAGGSENSATEKFTTIGGGSENSAAGDFATVGGGYANTASDSITTVGGGAENSASVIGATVGGGGGNTASGWSATIGGGYYNQATGVDATVGGGIANTAVAYATVGGGEWNKAGDGLCATVGGGRRNNAAGYVSVVGGGECDTAKGHWGGVFSGYSNLAGTDWRDTAAVVCGGYDNRVAGACGFVGGGKENTTTSYGVVCGGEKNLAAASHSVIPGGYADTVYSDYSFAAGNSVKLEVSADYTFAFGNNFTTSASHAVIFYDASVPTKVGIQITAPTEALDVDGTARLRNMPAGTGTDVVVDANGVLKEKSSSRRYKENIRELEPDPSLIFQLKPVRFDWKTTGEEDIGLIAEDVEEIIPDLVIHDAENKPDAVKYDKLAVYLLQVVKAQEDKISVLEQEIANLKKQQGVD